jgi:hypothetical protein
MQKFEKKNQQKYKCMFNMKFKPSFFFILHYGNSVPPTDDEVTPLYESLTDKREKSISSICWKTVFYISLLSTKKFVLTSCRYQKGNSERKTDKVQVVRTLLGPIVVMFYVRFGIVVVVFLVMVTRRFRDRCDALIQKLMVKAKWKK